MKGIRILWNPGAAGDAAQSSIWVPLLILGAAGTFADYPLLFKLTPAGLAEARLQATPEGLTPFAILFYLAMRWAAPILLPAAALLTGRFQRFYLMWVLDNKMDKAGISRIAAYGMLPLALERILAGTLALVCSGDCDRLNPAATNLAFFLDPKETSVFWYELARGVDLFVIWSVWALSAALARYAEEKQVNVWPGTAVLWGTALLLRSLLLG